MLSQPTRPTISVGSAGAGRSSGAGTAPRTRWASSTAARSRTTQETRCSLAAAGALAPGHTRTPARIAATHDAIMLAFQRTLNPLNTRDDAGSGDGLEEILLHRQEVALPDGGRMVAPAEVPEETPADLPRPKWRGKAIVVAALLPALPASWTLGPVHERRLHQAGRHAAQRRGQQPTRRRARTGGRGTRKRGQLRGGQAGCAERWRGSDHRSGLRHRAGIGCVRRVRRDALPQGGLRRA
jgi:hypothetical protein